VIWRLWLGSVRQSGAMKSRVCCCIRRAVDPKSIKQHKDG
jgi:hypothetical protein